MGVSKAVTNLYCVPRPPSGLSTARLSNDGHHLVEGFIVNVAIYALVDPRTNEIRYIGKSKDAAKRFKDHVCRRDEHNTDKQDWLTNLQIAGMKPKQIILELVDEGNWQDVERRWIAIGRKQNWPLTNIHPGGDGIPYDYHFSPEQRAQISQRLRGHPCSSETRAKISKANKGRRYSPEICAKMSEARRGKPGPTKGRRLSPEHCARLSEAHRGKPNPNKGKQGQFSPESRARLSEAGRRNWLSPEYREHMSEVARGKHHSPETRAKMSEAQRRSATRRKSAVPALTPAPARFTHIDTERGRA